MRVVIFFLCLCLFLLKGNDYARASSYSNPLHYSIGQSVKNSSGAVFIVANATMSDMDTDNVDRYLASEDLEDEDSSDLFAKKLKIAAACHSTIAYSFLLSYRCNSSINALSCHKRVSCKYILQRVLRV